MQSNVLERSVRRSTAWPPMSRNLRHFTVIAILLKFGRILMCPWLVLSVLSFFVKIGLISACFRLAGYSELDKALLKPCNIKYAIRSRSSLIILTGISEAWEAFLSLSKATSLRVCSKVTKWKLNLGRIFLSFFYG